MDLGIALQTAPHPDTRASLLGQIWFRIEDRRVGTGYVDVCGEYVSTGVEGRAMLKRFVVVKVTPKGVWLVPGDSYAGALNQIRADGKRRFQLTESNKQYACPTVEAALTSFEARKRRHAQILATRIDLINESVRLARAGQFGG